MLKIDSGLTKQHDQVVLLFDQRVQYFVGDALNLFAGRLVAQPLQDLVFVGQIT